MLNLWTGDVEQLQIFDKCIRDFLWSGQDNGKKPRVNWKTIKNALVEGCLSLISILEHTYAMVALGCPGQGPHSLAYPQG